MSQLILSILKAQQIAVISELQIDSNNVLIQFCVVSIYPSNFEKKNQLQHMIPYGTKPLLGKN